MTVTFIFRYKYWLWVSDKQSHALTVMHTLIRVTQAPWWLHSDFQSSSENIKSSRLIKNKTYLKTAIYFHGLTSSATPFQCICTKLGKKCQEWICNGLVILKPSSLHPLQKLNVINLEKFLQICIYVLAVNEELRRYAVIVSNCFHSLDLPHCVQNGFLHFFVNGGSNNFSQFAQANALGKMRISPVIYHILQNKIIGRYSCTWWRKSTQFLALFRSAHLLR